MSIRQKKQFQYGYNPIVTSDGEYAGMLMDFGIFKLHQGQEISDSDNKERAILLIKGEVEFEWGGHRAVVGRASCFDEGPWCLHVPPRMPVKISALDTASELSIHKTVNACQFEARLFTPVDCRAEQRGVPSLKDTATRIVRTVFDMSSRENSNLVLGETINLPGLWSSYPPHYHLQPEIYFYKFYPQNGFGYSEVGGHVHKVRNNDTVLVNPGMAHPQVAAPGYAMYYLWAIRHLDNLPYVSPTFVPEHTWVNDSDATIWPGVRSSR